MADEGPLNEMTAADGEILDFRPGVEMTWEILSTGPALEAVNRVAPGMGGPPLHIHPGAEESYEVLAGAMEVCVDGEWRVLRAGEKAVVPPGVPHTLRGHGDEAVELINVHSPALNFEAFFREFHRLASSGAVKLPPKDPRSLLQMGLLFSSYPDEIRSVRPPHPVMRALGALARRRGYRLGG